MLHYVRFNANKFLHRYHGPNGEQLRGAHGVTLEAVRAVQKTRRLEIMSEIAMAGFKPALVTSLGMLGAAFFMPAGLAAVLPVCFGLAGVTFTLYKTMGAAAHYSQPSSNLADLRPRAARLAATAGLVTGAAMMGASLHYAFQKVAQDEADTHQRRVLMEKLDDMYGPSTPVNLRTIFRVPADQQKPVILRVDAAPFTAPALRA